MCEIFRHCIYSCTETEIKLNGLLLKTKSNILSLKQDVFRPMNGTT